MMFHEVRFPTAISFGASGGPERRTDIVALGSGHEERNSRWADSRRHYNAGYGIKTLDQLHEAISFFEERRGQLYGFRWRDPMDWKSCPPQSAPSDTDQVVATGDGVTTAFQLVKRYGQAHAPWSREITKPVVGSTVVAVDGVSQVIGTDVSVDVASGQLTFSSGAIPASGATITAGFEFDVPVRFDTDRLDVNVQGFRHGAIPALPIVEIRL